MENASYSDGHLCHTFLTKQDRSCQMLKPKKHSLCWQWLIGIDASLCNSVSVRVINAFWYYMALTLEQSLHRPKQTICHSSNNITHTVSSAPARPFYIYGVFEQTCARNAALYMMKQNVVKTHISAELDISDFSKNYSNIRYSIYFQHKPCQI